MVTVLPSFRRATISVGFCKDKDKGHKFLLTISKEKQETNLLKSSGTIHDHAIEYHFIEQIVVLVNERNSGAREVNFRNKIHMILKQMKVRFAFKFEVIRV